MSRHSGLVVYEQIPAINALIPVIFISAAKTADTAIPAMKLGAFNYLHKPLELKELRGVVADASGEDGLLLAERCAVGMRVAHSCSSHFR